ncbi:MAG: hypothetical protein ACXQTR_05040, partial [Candidatus Methanospirareceae archaeon]
MRKIFVLLVLFGLLASSFAPLTTSASAQDSGIIITPVDPKTFQPKDSFQILSKGKIAFNVTNTRDSKVRVSVS